MNLKKFALLFLKILTVLLLICACFLAYILISRYYVSSPMQDIEYKKEIIKSSNNIFYKLENLRPIVGEEELTQFINENNKKPEIYTPSEENIKNGKFRANLHMHTTRSDGQASVEQRLDEAQEYAENNIKDGYMYIAITDHNTVLGTQDVIKILQKNPKKYKNIKIILGIEVYSNFRSKYYDKPVSIHVLCWCINPYDTFLNEEFYKADLADKWNYRDRDFDDVIAMMSEYSIPGVAHPVRYTNRIGKNKYLYIDEMFNRYKKLSTKPLFTEGYYQVYPRYYEPDFIKKEILPYSKYINKKADEMNITKTGSTDSHSMTIFD